MSAPATPRALGHLRVLDLSRVLAGPWATQNLADMGAEVIKIERPQTGDDTRSWGPPYLVDGQGEATTDAAYFASANRGKKSVTLDISKKEGQDLVRKMAASCDVFVENYKVGTMARYGLDYETLKAINPRLIYCSVTGFGQSGPYAPLPGYDFVFQGMGGLMSITGFPETPEGQGGPVKVGVALADILAGMYATVAILGALEHRHTSGQGQYIDLALLDCIVAATSYQAMNYLVSGKPPSLLGNAHPNMVPYQVFDCKDGKLILAIGNDSQYASFCHVVGRPELASDARFAKVPGRVTNREILVPIIAQLLREKTMSEWMTLLQGANVPCGPIYRMDQVFEDPQVQHRQIRSVLPHAAGAQVPHVASPLRMSETPMGQGVSAPLLGQHTQAVLNELAGVTPEQLASLRDKAVV